MRWLSIAVMSYMFLGITWWGVLLYQKNQQLFAEKLEVAESDDIAKTLISNYNRQRYMIIGEGVVLICSLFVGLFIINRSAKKEIQNAQQQSDFLLSVSHELKSPIAATRLALQTLQRQGLPPNKQSKIIRSALDDTKRLEKLVQNILVSANMVDDKLQLHKEKVDLTSLLKSIIDKIYNHQIIFTPSVEEIIIEADRLFLSQAITNIVENAVKYSYQNKPVHIELYVKNKNAYCTITNEGPSIQKEEQKKIFEKFYRGQSSEVRSKEGTGIGLYIAYQIVVMHEGNIEVTSQHNKNRFIISIPYHEQ